MTHRPVAQLELPLLSARRPPRFPSTTSRVPTTAVRLKPHKSRQVKLSTSMYDKRKTTRAPMERVVRFMQLEKLLASKRGILEPKDWTGAAENGPVLRQMYANWALEYTLASRKPETVDPEIAISLRRKEIRAKSVICRGKDPTPLEVSVTPLCSKQGTLCQGQPVLMRPTSLATTLCGIYAVGSAPPTRSSTVPKWKQRMSDRETDTTDLEAGGCPDENDENACPTVGLRAQ